MTTAKELLDAATPLPWESKSQSRTFDRYIQSAPSVGWPRGAKVGEIPNQHDAALAVYAVNHLGEFEQKRADYEAAVEALERIERRARIGKKPGESLPLILLAHIEEEARAALARLRSEVPA